MRNKRLSPTAETLLAPTQKDAGGQMAPTPRPWHVLPNTIGSIEAEDGTSVAQAQQVSGRDREEGHATRLANAELIVRAVNSFDDLLEALKEMRDVAAACFRVIDQYGKPAIDALETELSKDGIAEGFGKRAQLLIEKVEAPSV